MTKYTELPLYLRPFTQIIRKRSYPCERDTNDEPPHKKHKENKEINSKKEDKFIPTDIIYTSH